MSLLGDLWKENQWLPVVLGIVGVAVTFLVAGPKWGIAGLILVLTLLIIALGNSLIRIRKSLAEVASSSTIATRAEGGLEDAAEVHERLAEAVSRNEPKREDIPNANPQVTEGEENNAMFRAIDASTRGDRNGIVAALDPWVAEANTADERLGRTSFRLWLLANTGDSEALEALRSLAENNPGNRQIISRLALAFDRIGEPLRGAEEIGTRIENVPEEEKPSLVVQQATLLRQAGEAGSALDALSPLLADQQLEDEMKARALEEYGRCLEELGRRIEAVSYLEEAVTLAPTKASLRFDLAYKYADLDLYELAVLHYTNLVKVNRTDRGSLNNLGVALHALGAPIEGTASYMKAAKQGNPLAASNIARLLIGQGFLEEAERWLNEVGEGAKTDPDVMNAGGYIAGMQATEETRIPQILERGRQVRPIMRRLHPDKPSPLPEGIWTFSTQIVTEIEMKIDGETSTGTSGTSISKSELRVRKEGSLLRIDLHKTGFSRAHLEGKGVVEGGKLYGYLINTSSAPQIITPFLGQEHTPSPSTATTT